MKVELNERSRGIVRYNLLGIAMNGLLAVLKITIGILVRAHAVIIDGVNSLSDMISLGISIMSAFLAEKRSNSQHPFGYGRLEYLSSLFVTIIIMYVGVTTIIQTIEAIIHPHEAPSYNTTVIIIMIASFFLKFSYGILMRRKWRYYNSTAMKMTGTDSLGDSFFSLAVLIAIVVYRMTGLDIEHYLCIFSSLMIIMTGLGIIRECANKILGTRIDPKDKEKILNMISEYEEVLNVSNLVLHNYGEGHLIGSVDIEVDGKMAAADISSLSRRIINKARQFGIQLTAVGISGTNISEPEAMRIQDIIVDIATRYKGIKRVNSFTIDLKHRIISFYVVPDYSVKDREDDIREFRKVLKEHFPDFHIYIQEGIDV